MSSASVPNTGIGYGTTIRSDYFGSSSSSSSSSSSAKRSSAAADSVWAFGTSAANPHNPFMDNGISDIVGDYSSSSSYSHSYSSSGRTRARDDDDVVDLRRGKMAATEECVSRWCFR
jgi:hypothetical protein